LEYATETGKLTDPKGRRLAHCSVGTEEQSTIDVNDPRFADGPFGLRYKTGNVWEWVERNHNEEFQYGLRGGSWDFDNPEFLRVACRYDNYPGYRYYFIGFRVGAPAPQHSLSGS
jgi:formylglycine-generating enzyme required for sulfatase activity